MADVAWRPATAADIRAFYGQPVAQTLRAVVITVDGEPAGLIGLAADGPDQKFFSEEKPVLEQHRGSMAVLRALKHVMGWVARCPQLVVAYSKNRCLLVRLGFTHVEGDVFVWHT